MKISLSDLKAWRALTSDHRAAMVWGLFYLLKHAVLVQFPARGRALEVVGRKKPREGLAKGDPCTAVIAIARLSRRLRPQPSCLIQALALRDLLARAGLQAEIRLLAKRDDSASTYRFHAIVALNSQIIFGNDNLWQNASALKSPVERFV